MVEISKESRVHSGKAMFYILVDFTWNDPIANGSKSLASNSHVQICYQIDDLKFQDGDQNSKWPPFSLKSTVFSDN